MSIHVGYSPRFIPPLHPIPTADTPSLVASELLDVDKSFSHLNPTPLQRSLHIHKCLLANPVAIR